MAKYSVQDALRARKKTKRTEDEEYARAIEAYATGRLTSNKTKPETEKKNVITIDRNSAKTTAASSGRGKFGTKPSWTVQDALAARRETNGDSNAMSDVLEDIRRDYNTLVENYRAYKPVFGENASEISKSKQADARQLIRNLQASVDLYRDYMDEGTADEMLSSIEQIQSGYDAYSVMSKYESREAYDKDVRKYNYLSSIDRNIGYGSAKALQNRMDTESEEYEWMGEYARSVMTEKDFLKEARNKGKEAEALQAELDTYRALDEQLQLLIKGRADKSEIDAIKEQRDALDAKYGGESSLERMIEAAKNEQWSYNKSAEYGLLDSNEDYIQLSQADYSGWEQSEDPMFAYINNLDKEHNRPGKAAVNDPTMASYGHMTDEEIKNYNYLYNTQGSEAAYDYLDYLSYSLNERAGDQYLAAVAEYADNHEILGSFASVGATLAGGAGYISTALQKAANDIREKTTGEYRPIDTNTFFNRVGNAGSVIRETVAQNIIDATGVIDIDKEKHPLLSKLFNGKSLADVYQLGMSMLDSTVVAGLTAATGINFGFLLGGSAAAQSMLTAVNNGATDEEALLMGLFAGAFETLFESLSVETLLSGKGKTAIQRILNQAIAEGSEELNTSVANTISDVLVLAENSDYSAKIRKYMDENPDASYEEAYRAALMDNCVSIAWDTIGGMLSGGVMGGGASAVSSAASGIQQQRANTRSGQDIRSVEGGVESLDALAANVSAEAGGRTQKKFNRLTTAANKNSTTKLGRAVRDNRTGELYRQVTAAIAKSNKEDVVSGLKEKGISSAKAGKLADAIVTKAEGGNLTTAQQKLLASVSENESVQTVIKDIVLNDESAYSKRNRELNRFETGMAVGIGVTSETSDTDLLKAAAKKFLGVDVNEEGPAKHDVYINKTDTVTETAQREGRTATAEDYAESYGEQAQNFIDTYNSRRADPNAPSLTDFAKAYESAYNWGNAGVRVEYLSSDDAQQLTAALSDTQRMSAYTAGVNAAELSADRQNNENKAAGAGAKTALRKQGAISTYGYDRYGTKLTVAGINEAFAEKDENGKIVNRSTSRVKAFNFLSQLAAITGIDIVIYQSQAGEDGRLHGPVINDNGIRIDLTDANGAFVWNNNKIYLDMNAGIEFEQDLGDVAKYTFMRTFSHEFVHFCEKWNPKEYVNFRQLVFKHMDKKLAAEYEKNGSGPRNVNELIEMRMETENRGYDYCSREVVADAMTDILPESEFARELAEKHKNIFEKLLDELIKFLDGIKKYFSDIAKNEDPGAAAVREKIGDSIRYIEDIVKLYDQMAIAAVENYQAAQNSEQKNTTNEGDVSYKKRTPAITEDKYFARRIDKWESLKDNERIKVGEIEPGSIISLVGIPSGGLYFDVGKIKKSMTSHSDHIEVDDLKRIPEMLSDPVVITEFVGKGNIRNTVSVYGELRVNSNVPIVIGLVIRKDRSGQNFVTNIRTIHARSDAAKLITDDTVLYITKNKKRAQNWFQVCGISVPLEGSRSGLIRSIQYAEEKVNKDDQAAQNTEQKNTTNEGDVSYSIKRKDHAADTVASNVVHKSPRAATNTDRITPATTDKKRAEILSKKVLEVPEYNGEADTSIQANKEKLESWERDAVKAALVRIGEEFDVFKEYKITDVDVKIMFSKENIRESVSKKISPVQIAKLLPIFKDAVENSVGIESHINRYFYDNHTTFFENLLGGYIEGNHFVPIRFGLKHFSTGEATLYIIVDQNKIDVQKIKAEVVKATSAQKVQPKSSRSAYELNLSQIIPFVNSKDLLRYIPDEMLNTEQRVAKWEGIAETIQYTNEKNDKKYKAFVSSGKIGALRQMVDAAAKAAGYATKAFHQTNVRFTEFNTDNELAGKYDTDTPTGMFFKPTDADIGISGDIQMPVYLKTENMLEFRDRADIHRYWMENVDGYAELQAELDNIEKRYDAIYTEAEEKADAWYDEHYDDYVADKISMDEVMQHTDAPLEEILTEWKAAENPVRRKMKSLITAYMKDGNYDSIHLIVDGMRKGVTIETYIVFNPNQIKSADPITYDDDGNVIPISERFNEEKTDIRYQRRSDTLTDREVLELAALTLDRSTLTEGESAALDIFNERMGKLRDLQIERERLGSLWHEQQFVSQDYNAAKETMERMRIYDARIARATSDVLSIENKKVLDRVLRMARAVAKKDATDHYRGIIERRRNRSKEAEARQELFKTVSQLNTLLIRGDKKNHVPEGLKKTVARALNAINAADTRQEDRAAKIDKQLAELYQLKVKLRASLTDENSEVISAQILQLDKDIAELEKKKTRSDKIKDLLLELGEAYSEIEKGEDPEIVYAYDLAVAKAVDAAISDMKDTTVSEMNLGQLRQVADVYKMVLKSVRNANKAFTQGKNESINALISRTINEIQKVGGTHEELPGITAGVRAFLWNNLKPVYAMEKIGSDTLGGAFWALIDGEGKYARDIRDAVNYVAELKAKYKYDEWDFKHAYEFESTAGTKFKLTLEQIMSLYAYSKREQSYDHLAKGGFVFDSNIEAVDTNEKKVGKVKQLVRKIAQYKINVANAHQISAELLDTITSDKFLKEEQKGFVDEMQRYLSDVMGAKGNEVSMIMYDVKLFNEKNYFPLKSAKQFLYEQNELAGEVKIKGSGFTNRIQPGANNPVILSNFLDVCAQHIHDMSMYHAFALPIEDFNRIYSGRTRQAEGIEPLAVTTVLQNAYGREAVDYLHQMVVDINGGARSDPRESPAKKLVSKFKKASVMASGSVVIQQPSAMFRARALIDEKYFGHWNPKLISHRRLWEEVEQYAPIAIIKKMGRFDMDTGMGTVEQIKNDKSVMDKVDDFFSWAPGFADEWAWVQIWEAVKRETLAKNTAVKAGSEEHLRLAGRRFTEVIVKTQVYDSTLSRSGFMRSKSALMNMATAFMAEPTTSINMIEYALREWRKGTKEGRKIARKYITSVLGSVIVNSLLVSIVYAMRDDDKDKTFLEKYFSSVTSELLDGVNVLTYYPWVKDVWSLLQGFDVERSDMSVFADIAQTINTLGEEINKDTDEMTDEKLQEHNAKIHDLWFDFATNVMVFCGVPAKNIRRAVIAITNTLNTEFGLGEMWSWEAMRDAIAMSAKKALPRFARKKDDTKAEKLYRAIVEGDDAYYNRLASGYDSESKLDAAIRGALRENEPRIKAAAEAKYNGDVAEYSRIAKELVAEGLFSQNNIVAAINSEIAKLTPNDGSEPAQEATGLYTADDFALAVAQDDITLANAIKADIIATSELNGKTADKAEESFRSGAKGACKDLLLSGELTADDAVNVLVEFCNLTESQALADVRYWEFKNENPDTYVNDAWFDTYYEKVESSGVDIKMYMEYRNDVADITGDDKKERRMNVIHALPLTDVQKDALYFAEGWSESTLDEAPWHQD